MSDLQRSYRTNFCAYVHERSIIPRKEENDARILAECAIAEIPMLVTSDGSILSADPNDLQLAFQDAGLPNVLPIRPSTFVAALSRMGK
jgi:hypothetical protein